MPWYQISVPVAGGAFRVVWGSNLDAALAGARAELKNRWGIDDRYFDSFISPTIQEVAPDGPPPQGSAELTWGPPRDYTSPGMGGYTQPGGGQPGPGVGPTGVGPSYGGYNPPGGLENVFPEGAFARALRAQGENPEGIFGAALREFQPALQGAYNIQNVLGQLPASVTAVPNEGFQRFVTQNPVSSFRDLATRAFQTISAPGPQPSENAQQLLAQYQDPYGTVNDPKQRQNLLNQMFALGQQAAASRYSPFTANQLLPTQGQFTRRYEEAGAPPGGFLDFLKKQLGLAGVY